MSQGMASPGTRVISSSMSVVSAVNSEAIMPVIISTMSGVTSCPVAASRPSMKGARASVSMSMDIVATSFTTASVSDWLTTSTLATSVSRMKASRSDWASVPSGSVPAEA